MSAPATTKVLCLGLAAWLVGCAGEGVNELAGSVEEIATLEFDEVRAEWVLDALVLRYVRSSETVPSEPLRMLLGKPSTEALNEDIPHQAIRMERYVLVRGSSGRLSQEPQLPPTSEGWLRLSAVGTKVGDPVTGSFSFHLEDGHTLYGSFDTKVYLPGK